MNCPNCQQNLQNDFKFCPYCGAEVSRNLFCPSCGNKVEPKWVSCPNCGGALGGIAQRQTPQKAPQQAPQQHIPQPEHQPYGYHNSSSGRKHRRKKGFLGGLFSS